MAASLAPAAAGGSAIGGPLPLDPLRWRRPQCSCVPSGLTACIRLSYLIKYYFDRMVNQFSPVQSCPTLCDPMDCSTPGLTVHHQLPEFTQTHVHPLGHPLSSTSPPAFYLSQHQGLFQWISLSTVPLGKSIYLHFYFRVFLAALLFFLFCMNFRNILSNSGPPVHQLSLVSHRNGWEDSPGP